MMPTTRTKVPTIKIMAPDPCSYALIAANCLRNLLNVLEHFNRQADPDGREPLRALRTNASRAESADDLPFGIHPRSLEQEDVLHRDHVLLHRGQLGDGRDLARAISHPRDLHEDIHR